MKPFNAEVMAEYLEGDESAKKYRDRQVGSEEDRLGKTYLTIVLGSKRRMAEYNQLYDDVLSGEEEEKIKRSPNALLPDSPLTAEIRKLVNANGWRAFARALAAFAHSKTLQMQQMGMTSFVEAWAFNTKRFRALRKNAQL